MCNINFWTFPKIHQFWWRHPSLMTENLIKPWQGRRTCGWNKGQGDPRWSLFVDKQFRKNTWFLQQKNAVFWLINDTFSELTNYCKEIFCILHFYKKERKESPSSFSFSCPDLTAQSLDKKDLFSESDPFYIIYRRNPDGSETLVSTDNDQAYVRLLIMMLCLPVLDPAFQIQLKIRLNS